MKMRYKYIQGYKNGILQEKKPKQIYLSNNGKIFKENTNESQINFIGFTKNIFSVIFCDYFPRG